MSEKNIFLRPVDGYKRNLDIVGTASKLAADYLHQRTGKPIEDCIAFVQKEISPSGRSPVKSIELKVMKRMPNQDRVRSSVPLDKVLTYVEKSKSVLAPNFVIYDGAQTNRSCTAKYVEDKMTQRGIVKKRGFKAKQTGDMVTYAYCHNAEYGIKVFTNSLSGAHASPHNALYNKTAHSSLTSNTRSIVSYSNASTEKFLEGNRHYFSKDVIIENILSITHFTDYDLLKENIKKYNLYIPTVEDVIKLIKRCTKFYWQNDYWHEEIYRLVCTLNDYQRAAFTYTGDLYHLAKFNQPLIRTFLTTMVTRPTSTDEIDADSVIAMANDGIVSLTGILCADILAGETVDKVKEKSPEGYVIYARTIKHVIDTINQYADLLTGMFVTDSVPSAIYEFPNSIRRCVVGSDTDSTMFTTQSWIEWYFGRLAFGREADKIANTLCFLNTQVIAHMLATCSRQMGVEDRNLYRLEMKNEYGFPVYIRANRAKHYATLLASREGNVYKVPENDIKGVGLKDSKVPRSIMERLEKEINNIMMNILAEKGVSIYPLMQRIANLEWTIYNSLTAGSLEFLSTQNISAKNAYKKPMASKYVHYDLWINVFQHKFGLIAEPPYRAIKVSTTLDTTARTNQWIGSLDPMLALKFNEWIATNKRKQVLDDFGMPVLDKDGQPIYEKKPITFEQLLLPYELFEKGIPEEFLRVMNKRSIISELMAGFYILLEMVGFYIRGKNANILLYDDIPYKPEFGLPGDKV